MLFAVDGSLSALRSSHNLKLLRPGGGSRPKEAVTDKVTVTIRMRSGRHARFFCTLNHNYDSVLQHASGPPEDAQDEECSRKANEEQVRGGTFTIWHST